MYRWLTVLAAGLLLAGCVSSDEATPNLAERPIRVVATTSMVADLVTVIGGDRVDVEGLMGPGVDPHLYKASEGDVTRMAEADVVFYNGLHLEGRMTELFERMADRGTPTVAVAETIAPDRLLDSPDYPSSYDPHVWFDVQLWAQAARVTRDALAALDTTHAATYHTNADAYLASLDSLDAFVRAETARIPLNQRVLITSHDAFGYFGAAYGFEVLGLQGLSTATEAGIADVQQLATTVAERRIPALFVESSVSPRGIEAVREAVRARGFEVEIGGRLYSDALGSPGTEAETYLGTVRANVNTIVGALAPPAPLALR
ncbi:MAG: zinc ABC transporter substrate-binding protein [Bacteroidota bacterium]